eukprot:2073458-Amphidinium_carterae.1
MSHRRLNSLGVFSVAPKRIALAGKVGVMMLRTSRVVIITCVIAHINTQLAVEGLVTWSIDFPSASTSSLLLTYQVAVHLIALYSHLAGFAVSKYDALSLNEFKDSELIAYCKWARKPRKYVSWQQWRCVLNAHVAPGDGPFTTVAKGKSEVASFEQEVQPQKGNGSENEQHM